MKILALQLKRIGDLVLTTPALRAIRGAWPGAHLALGVMEGTAALLPAIPFAQGAIVFGRGRGIAPWQQVFTGGWDLCLDFTGNDRSALASALSRAKTRAAFEWARRNKIRALAYNTACASAVREVHTAQHYLDLVNALRPAEAAPAKDLQPELALPAGGAAENYALLHPGTARPEKYWLAERWAAVAEHLHAAHRLPSVITCGPHPFEQAHAAAIEFKIQNSKFKIIPPSDLLALAQLVARARLVVSCDTGVVHLAAAFRVPQVVLFGPTNPFHWRPMHERAIVISAAQPAAPLTHFEPRMPGAPMERISTEVVIRAIDSLLAAGSPGSSSFSSSSSPSDQPG